MASFLDIFALGARKNPKQFLLGTKGKPEEQVDLTPSEFAGTRGATADALKGLIDSGGGAKTEGPLVAPISGNEQDLVRSAVEQADTNNPLARATRSLANRTAEGEFLTGGRILEEGVASALDPTRAAIERLGLPTTGSELTASGGRVATGENPFATAANIAITGGQNALSDLETSVRSQSFLAEAARQQEAIKLASDVASGGLKKTILGLKAAALPRLIEDLGIQRGLAEFNDRINRLLESISTGVAIGAPVVRIKPGDPGSPGLAKGGLQAIGGLFASGAIGKNNPNPKKKQPPPPSNPGQGGIGGTGRTD